MIEPTKIQELEPWDGITPPASELQVAVGHASFGAIPKRADYSAIVTNPTTVLLGTELLPSTGWTTTGWTGSLATGFTHTAGNTSDLSNTIAAIVDTIYQVAYIVTGRTTGTFSVDFGGITSTGNSATNTETLKAVSNANFVITPTTDFDGKIEISIKQVTWELTEAEILSLLGVPDVVQSSQLAAYALAVSGKSLVLDTIIAKLPQCYTINLPAAANLAAKIAAASEGTDYPTGWVLTATDTVNLTITHNLGKEIDHVTVKKVVGAVKTILKPYSTAYSEVKATTTSILVIEGIDPTATQTLIHLTFMP